MASLQPPAVFSALRLKGIKPVLDRLAYLGIDPIACLNGTEIKLDDVASVSSSERSISLEQEFKLYSNILERSASPHIGLQLGAAYHADTFGALGFALKNAPSVIEAARVAIRYSPLTLSFFRPVLIKSEPLGGIALERQYAIPAHLLQVFSDRAVVATLTTLRSSVGVELSLKKVCLMHGDEDHKAFYADFFDCEVEFCCRRNEIWVEGNELHRQLPNNNPVFFQHCVQECRKTLSAFRSRSELFMQIKSVLLAEPKGFPSAEEVAARLGWTTRTLRRKLAMEGERFQTIVNEVKREQAKDFLQSGLAVEKVAELLGYSEAAAFSHAFKGWESVSPRAYRQELLQDRAMS